jgi:putative salt-induced outer membrane protein YdiY
VTNNREADFRWRYDINKRLFAQSLTTYESDEVRKLDLGVEQQFGGGYRLVDNDRHKVNVGLGAVVQFLARANSGDQTALLGAFFQDYAYQWNSRVKLVEESSLMVSDTGTLNVKSALTSTPVEGSYRMRFNTGVQSKVTDRMSLNVRFEYDYDRSVLDHELRADQRLTTSLGYIW